MPDRVHEVSILVTNDEDRCLTTMLKTPDGAVEEGSLMAYMGIWYIDAYAEWGDDSLTAQQILRVRVRAKILDEVFYDNGYTIIHYNRDPETPQTWRLDLRLKSRVQFVPKGGYREDGFVVELVPTGY